MSKANRNLRVVRRAGNIFGCPRVPKGFFSAYVSFSLNYCVPVRMSSAKSDLDLPDSMVHSVERMCEGFFFGHRRKVMDLCLLCKICQGVNHPMNEYLKNFVAARNTRPSAALGEYGFGDPTLQKFSPSFSVCCAYLELAAVGCVEWWHI